jgi:hypothetical protein
MEIFCSKNNTSFGPVLRLLNNFFTGVSFSISMRFLNTFMGKTRRQGHCAQNLMSFKMRVNKMGLKTDQFSRLNAYF